MDNMRGILLMVGAMAAFALEDMFIKRVAADLPTGQILAFLGLGGTLAFGLAALRARSRLVSRDLLLPAVMLRNLGELIGTIGFVTALALTPLSTASAILQATPLAVTFGAALFLGAEVGWRRWSAIAAGFAGVLIIIRPGLAGFEPASLFAVQGVAGLALRDLATRRVPAKVTTVQLSAYAFAMLIVAGAFLLAIDGPARAPSPVNWRDLGFALGIGICGYWAITGAMRVGEIAVVTPFRYTRMVFALGIGALAFGERPDAATLGGAGLIIASGLYTIFRERRLARRTLSSAPPVG
ncbi:DMT family transporter [Rhodovulum sp. YNF3179]|uniref:DMT family transporter n=1 Tax=Rhodovulum sp. YNF3179 TaxID=3425127 RepID=UPI003D328C91